jgi:hypothetical protein
MKVQYVLLATAVIGALALGSHYDAQLAASHSGPAVVTAAEAAPAPAGTPTFEERFAAGRQIMVKRAAEVTAAAAAPAPAGTFEERFAQLQASHGVTGTSAFDNPAAFDIAIAAGRMASGFASNPGACKSAGYYLDSLLASINRGNGVELNQAIYIAVSNVCKDAYPH